MLSLSLLLSTRLCNESEQCEGKKISSKTSRQIITEYFRIQIGRVSLLQANRFSFFSRHVGWWLFFSAKCRFIFIVPPAVLRSVFLFYPLWFVIHIYRRFIVLKSFLKRLQISWFKCASLKTPVKKKSPLVILSSVYLIFYLYQNFGSLTRYLWAIYRTMPPFFPF